MSPVVRIPDPLFQRLQRLATPIVDSAADVIDRLVTFYETHNREAHSTNGISGATTGALIGPSSDAPRPQETSAPVRLARPDIAANHEHQSPRNERWANRKIYGFTLLHKTYAVSSWKEMFAHLLTELYRRNATEFERVLNIGGRKRVYVGRDGTNMHTPERLRDTPFYFEANQSADTFVRVACDILDILGIPLTEIKFTADRPPTD